MTAAKLDDAARRAYERAQAQRRPGAHPAPPWDKVSEGVKNWWRGIARAVYGAGTL